MLTLYLSMAKQIEKSSSNAKRIICINTTPEVASLIDKIFNDSKLVANLGSKGSYTNNSTWMKMSLVHFLKSNPSASKLLELFEDCKNDATLLPVLTGEVNIGK